MVTIRLETFIAAPPERVFDLARDLERHMRRLLLERAASLKSAAEEEGRS